MSKKFKFLTMASLNKKIKTKWFAIINIILVIAIVSLINIDTIIDSFGGDFNKETSIKVIDNTDKAYELFNKSLTDSKNIIGELNDEELKVVKSNKSEKELTKEINNNKTIVLVFNNDETNVLNAKVISNSYIDVALYQRIVTAINGTKSSLAILESNINIEDLNKISSPVAIEREYIDESKNQSEENMNIVMSIVFPTIILPFFMLIIFLVNTLGAEINEEKTTRGMEIIISNVSPKVHFASKILAGNLFVLIQGAIFLGAGLLGLFIRKMTSTSTIGLSSIGLDFGDIWKQLVESGFADKLAYVIPLTIVLMALSFIAYSLLAGILASMTTSMEDYQQLQTPIILVSLAGYYLSILAPTFEGSIFIRIISYIPFISALLCPPLLVIGQIGIIDMFISIGLLIGIIYLMITYGLKIYKVGILNYSTTKLWRKMVKAVKE